MISFFANLFGYLLNFLYELCKNYGVAIILFSILIKLAMLPISIKQQKTMKKSAKIQEEMKQIQFKYKNDPEKMNQEIMDLYKRANMSPFSGCFSSIAQLILLFSVFYLVRAPLTYMRKIDSEAINQMQAIVKENGATKGYEEIAIIDYVRSLESANSVNKENDNEKTAENNQENNTQETNNENINQENKSEFNIYDYVDEINMNMDFLGVDLSKVPTQDLKDPKVLIIPVLYVITSFISIKLSTSMQNAQNKNKKKEDDKEEEYDAMAQTNKMMTWMMPIMSVSIASIAPLGLALYWLMNNVLMILERIIMNKIIKDEEEANDNA